MKKAKVKSVRKRSTRAQVLEIRKQIAIMLGTGMKVSSIAKLMEMTNANVHNHVRKMKDAGMISKPKTQSLKAKAAPATNLIATPSRWTMQTPFGSVSLADGATIKIVGRTAEITW
jgi:DNA-binding transcriptional MerR regulator